MPGPVKDAQDAQGVCFWDEPVTDCVDFETGEAGAADLAVNDNKRERISFDPIDGAEDFSHEVCSETWPRLVFVIFSGRL